MPTVNELVKSGTKQMVRGVHGVARTITSLPSQIADLPKDVVEGGRHLEHEFTTRRNQLATLATQLTASARRNDGHLITSSSPKLHIIGPGIGSPENVAMTREIHGLLTSTEAGSKLLRDLRNARTQGYDIRLGVADSLHGQDVGGTLYDAEGGAVERYKHCDRETGRMKPGTYNLLLDKRWITERGIEPSSVAAHELGHAHLGITSGKHDRAALQDPVNAAKYIQAEELFVIKHYENPVREELGLKRRTGLDPVRDR